MCSFFVVVEHHRISCGCNRTCEKVEAAGIYIWKLLEGSSAAVNAFGVAMAPCCYASPGSGEPCPHWFIFVIAGMGLNHHRKWKKRESQSSYLLLTSMNRSA